MRTERLDDLARASIVESGVAPAAVLAVAARRGDEWRVLTGAAGTRSRSRAEPVAPETPFDLASVTKPVVACAVARLVRSGLLSFEAPLARALPEVSNTASGPLPISLFLAHRAGLDAHRALYLPLKNGATVDRAAAIREAANARREECPGEPAPGGFAPLYSDLGYVLVGEAASRAGGSDLTTIVSSEVAAPLHLDVGAATTWLAHDHAFTTRVAPTEIVDFRGGEIVGVVHDENAWALAGLGLAGHAGLFGTAESVARFGAAVLDALVGRRTDGRSASGSSAGDAFGPRSFGHLGFTGTSLWCDPDAGVVAVILTNRVNPTRDNVAIRSVRPSLNDALHDCGVELALPGAPRGFEG
jgi:CubicO group peptidase (beta-lactamase class C family)